MAELEFPVDEKELSSKELAALVQFRSAVEELPNVPENNDRYYLRWLRARKFDVAKAITMLRKHLEYRAQFGADTIMEDWTPPEVLINCFPGGFFGEDKDGRPVWYDCMGNLDFRGLHRSATKEDIRKLKCLHAAQCDVLLKQQSAKNGKPIEKVVSVVDFENLSKERHFYWPGLEVLKQVLSDVEANCPERIQYVFVVKAPSIFPLCYNLVKPIFDEKTRKKIHVLGANWRSVLQEYISEDQLPEAYGGKCCEPDAFCSTYVRPGCDIPPHYYFINQTKTSREDMHRASIAIGASFKLHKDVVEGGSTLHWEFISIDYDIKFGVTLVTDGHKQEVVALQRCDSHMIPQVGQHLCQSPGQYTIKFDNSFSWTRSKEVFYTVTLRAPHINNEM